VTIEFQARRPAAGRKSGPAKTLMPSKTPGWELGQKKLSVTRMVTRWQALPRCRLALAASVEKIWLRLPTNAPEQRLTGYQQLPNPLTNPNKFLRTRVQ